MGVCVSDKTLGLLEGVVMCDVYWGRVGDVDNSMEVVCWHQIWWAFQCYYCLLLSALCGLLECKGGCRLW